MFKGIIFGLIVAILGFGAVSLSIGPVEMTTAVPEAGMADDAPAPDDSADAGEDAVQDQGGSGEEMAPENEQAEDSAVDVAPEIAPASEAVEEAPDMAAPAEDDMAAPADDMAEMSAPDETMDGADEMAAPEVSESDSAMPAMESDDTVNDDTVPAMEGAESGTPDIAEMPAEDGDSMEDVMPDAMPEAMPADDAAMPEGEGAEAVMPEDAPTQDVTPEATPDMTADSAEMGEAEQPAEMPAIGSDDAPDMAMDQPEEMEEDQPQGLPETGVVTSRLPRIGDDTPAEDAAPDDEAVASLAPVAPLPSAGMPESKVEGVVTGRLPTINAADGESDAADPVLDSTSQPALERNAIRFTASTGQPLLSLLLIDTGDGRDTLRDLDKLPFPVTVAVDASASDAAKAIDFYRVKGAEVALIVPLPAGASATDVEVTLQGYDRLLSQAVAAMVADKDGFQTLGAGAVQFGGHLLDQGLGLVTFPSGLNTGHKAALKEGVHAGLVFRDLDGEGQNGATIQRFLDNAAFRARNQNGVIVVARTHGETVQALLEWSLGNRAQTVALAPLSAVLLEQ
ncbi:MAG: divergent polysaccharide deacetylase family protein [Maritimibacter sp.]